MPEEFTQVMIWRRCCGFASLEIAVLVYVGYLGLTAMFFVKRDTAVGIICAICAVLCGAQPFGILLALVFGWLRAGRYRFRGFMALWTALLAFFVLNIAATQLPNATQVYLARGLFGPPYYPGE